MQKVTKIPLSSLLNPSSPKYVHSSMLFTYCLLQQQFCVLQLDAQLDNVATVNENIGTLWQSMKMFLQRSLRHKLQYSSCAYSHRHAQQRIQDEDNNLKDNKLINNNHLLLQQEQDNKNVQHQLQLDISSMTAAPTVKPLLGYFFIPNKREYLQMAHVDPDAAFPREYCPTMTTSFRNSCSFFHQVCQDLFEIFAKTATFQLYQYASAGNPFNLSIVEQMCDSAKFKPAHLVFDQQVLQHVLDNSVDSSAISLIHYNTITDNGGQACKDACAVHVDSNLFSICMHCGGSPSIVADDNAAPAAEGALKLIPQHFGNHQNTNNNSDYTVHAAYQPISIETLVEPTDCVLWLGAKITLFSGEASLPAMSHMVEMPAQCERYTMSFSYDAPF